MALQERQAEQDAAAVEERHAAEAEEEEDLSLFEVRRRANIKRNRERMASMGLSPAALPGQPNSLLILQTRYTTK